MYRRPKFLEMLLEIRREMALEADYDVDLFVGRLRMLSEPLNGKMLADFDSSPESTDIEADISQAPKRSREIRKG